MLNARGGVRLPGSPVAGEGISAISSSCASVKSFGCDRRQFTLDRLLSLEGLGGGLEFLGCLLALERADVTHGFAIDDDRREEQLIRPETLLAHFAVDQRIGEAGDVTRRLPDLGMHDDGRLDADDVVAAANHVVPPAVADVLLQLGAERAVVEETVQPAVDLRRLEDETAALRERDDVVHGDGGAVDSATWT